MGNFVKVNVATGLSTDWSMSGTPVNDLDATLGSMGFTSGSYQLTSISKRKNA